MPVIGSASELEEVSHAWGPRWAGQHPKVLQQARGTAPHAPPAPINSQLLLVDFPVPPSSPPGPHSHARCCSSRLPEPARGTARGPPGVGRAPRPAPAPGERAEPEQPGPGGRGHARGRGGSAPRPPGAPAVSAPGLRGSPQTGVRWVLHPGGGGGRPASVLLRGAEGRGRERGWCEGDRAETPPQGQAAPGKKVSLSL